MLTQHLYIFTAQNISVQPCAMFMRWRTGDGRVLPYIARIPVPFMWSSLRLAPIMYPVHTVRSMYRDY